MKLLIVSPYYAPYSRVGSVRMVSLSRYLAKQGHSVTVFALDEKSLEEEAGSECLNSPVPENVTAVRFSVTSGKGLHYIKRERIRAEEFRRQLEAYLQTQKFDLVLVSCGPFYTIHHIKEISQKYSLPYIIDYRDLGGLNTLPSASSLLLRMKNRAVAYWEASREKQCAKSAAHLVVVCPGDQEKTQSAFHIPPSDITTIYNGYDDSVLPPPNTWRKPNATSCVRVGYFGKFMVYSPQRGGWLLEALDALRREGTDIALHHIGAPNPLIEEYIRKKRLDPAVYVGYGDMDYPKGMEALSQNDILASEHVHPTGLGTKVFDYIYLNRPIISISPPEIYYSKFLSQFENCFICNSKEEIQQAVSRILDEQLYTLSPGFQPEDYSRSRQNQRYEKLLDALK